MGHGNGTEIGGGPAGNTFVNTYLNTQTAQSYTIFKGSWRMRKVALWACYTDSSYVATASGTLPSWAGAFGIRPCPMLTGSLLAKNVGLFFAGELPQGGYGGTLYGSSVEAAADLDQLWVTGQNSYSGGCDPTYAFSWALNAVTAMNPILSKALPVISGFPYLPYAGVYDGKLMTNDYSDVKLN